MCSFPGLGIRFGLGVSFGFHSGFCLCFGRGFALSGCAGVFFIRCSDDGRGGHRFCWRLGGNLGLGCRWSRLVNWRGTLLDAVKFLNPFTGGLPCLLDQIGACTVGHLERMGRGSRGFGDRCRDWFGGFRFSHHGGRGWRRRGSHRLGGFAAQRPHFFFQCRARGRLRIVVLGVQVRRGEGKDQGAGQEKVFENLHDVLIAQTSGAMQQVSFRWLAGLNTGWLYGKFSISEPPSVR